MDEKQRIAIFIPSGTGIESIEMALKKALEKERHLTVHYVPDESIKDISALMEMNTPEAIQCLELKVLDRRTRLCLLAQLRAQNFNKYTK